MKVLEMQCPECGHYGGHAVEQTERDPSFLTCITKKKFPVFMPNYRVRIRRCVRCNQSFDSVEMPEQYLAAMVSEIRQLQDIEKFRTEDKQKIEDLTNKLKTIAEISNNI
jgi:hypothetical protein